MSGSAIVPSCETSWDSAAFEQLVRLVDESRSLVILTGAGCSTESGIPDYRSPGGSWSRHRPIQYREFIRSAERRRRYWARSFVGWRRFASAEPNGAHAAIAAIEKSDRLLGLITQNVDELHTRAGSRYVVELHGSNHRVVCLECRTTWPREDHQARLSSLNPMWEERATAIAPDGDAPLDARREREFVVADCDFCGGIAKPDVVFFGESVPKDRVATAMRWVERADLLLVVGSSLTVWSGFRFARAAGVGGIPVAAVNIGPTRADDRLTVKVEGRCSEVLRQVTRDLGGSPLSLQGDPHSA